MGFLKDLVGKVVKKTGDAVADVGNKVYNGVGNAIKGTAEAVAPVADQVVNTAVDSVKNSISKSKNKGTIKPLPSDTQAVIKDDEPVRKPKPSIKPVIDTGTITPIVPKPEVGETPTMTYEDFINEQKTREEEKRQAALKEAEIYKERAAADAQASYMQNMSTYGVNAETMAQMGLTGGGYSDYLNAQAYAQKRSDMQAADRNKIAMEQQAETTYADGIAALDKDYFTYQEAQRQNKTTGYNTLLGYAMDANSGMTEETIRAMAKNIGLSEEEIQSIINTMNTAQSTAKSEYANNAFSALIADLQNSNAYGNYSEAGIRALGKQWGWTNEQIGQAVDIWNDTKKGAEVSLDEEAVSPYGASAVIDGVRSGVYDEKTREELYETCLQYRNKGYMTDKEIEQVMGEYDRRYAYAEGKLSVDDYYNATSGNEYLQAKADNKANASELLKKYMGVSSFTGGNIVDIDAKDYGSAMWGTEITEKTKDSEYAYLDSIARDARDGKIKTGQLVARELGFTNNPVYYVYLGAGIFVSFNSSLKAKHYADKLYLPDGYGFEPGSWNITKK